ncbi:CpXC domain-containing protein [Ignavigranum ruoffiae]|uniref:CpXC domain-containing protein n=1 Tax=Ignavigranum ruoffiae TaxID=89093 RepID=UPI0020597B85|nr:CpXC domain-containing protein [Ignavigranum ruoffiae]UPQ86102.1 CpXC domain-containing protein [Ignavigranum ruoffiae]
MKQCVTIQCPVCQHEQEKEIWTKIDAQADPEAKASLLAGEIFNFECEQCGARRQIDSDFLYLDHEKHFIVSLIPNLEERKEAMEEILGQFMRQSSQDLTNYTLRVVRDAPSLVEKVSILDQGLNDIVIEIVKLLTDGIFAKERPEDSVKARYFYLHHSERKLLYITDTDSLIVDFHQSLLDFAEDKYKKAINEDTQGRFIVVDHHWAANLLEKKPGQAVKEYADQQQEKPLTKHQQQRIAKKLKRRK